MSWRKTKLHKGGRFKIIFKDTPFVKYADENGVVYLSQNFYHHNPNKLRAFGYSVSQWQDETGKIYALDNILTDTTYSRFVLTSDVVLTPVYTLNEEDLGDGTVTPVWNFGLPDSTVLFDNFKGTCWFVKPELYNSYYCDIAMACDATNGLIHNNGRTADGNAIVKAGTRFRLPSRYGTVYTLVTTEELTATTIAGRTDYTKGMAGINHTSTLAYCNSTTDSIDIVVGEDIHLVSISASYPGGDTTPTWIPNTNVAGAVFNIPLTRCDDAHVSGNNLLKVSNGTEVADRTKYFFRKTSNNIYAFHLDNDGRTISEGEIYLEYDTFTDPKLLFLNANDALVNSINNTSSGNPDNKTQKVFKKGRLYILNSDGSIYTLDGVRIK